MSASCDAALAYRRSGLAPIPVRARSKVPLDTNWPTLALSEDEIRLAFNDCNVGVVLGRASNMLVDVDLDTREARVLAPAFLPETGRIFGRASARASHLLYRVRGEGRTRRFADPVGGETLVEIRADGAQTVFPPSIHPSGETIEWECEGGPAEVASTDLHAAVAKLAAAALLARHWPAPGGRHNASVPLAGLLLRGGWTEDDVCAFLVAVAQAAGDEEAATRAHDAVSTAERLRTGRPATGAPTLAEIVGEPVVRTAASWLGIEWSGDRRAHARGAGAVLVMLSEIESVRVQWLWLGRVPRGKVTLIDGDPGLGKSTMALDLAARVSTGRPMPEQPAGAELVCGDVVVLSAEDDAADTIRPRLEAADADLSRVHVLQCMRAPGGERLFELPGDLDELKRIIDVHNVRMVLLDPLAAYVGGEVNMHRDQDVRRVLSQLARIAAETGAAIVVIRHLNKAQGMSAMYRGGGSIGIVAAVRSALLVAKDPQDPELRVLAPVKSNLAARPDALAFRVVESGAATRIEWLGPTPWSADELVTPLESAGSGSAVDEARAFLLAVLADGRVPERRIRELAGEAEITWSAIKRAKAALRIRSTRVGRIAGDGHWEWGLPNELRGLRGQEDQGRGADPISPPPEAEPNASRSEIADGSERDPVAGAER